MFRLLSEILGSQHHVYGSVLALCLRITSHTTCSSHITVLNTIKHINMGNQLHLISETRSRNSDKTNQFLLASGMGADLKIQCSGYSFAAHGNVLHALSNFFADLWENVMEQRIQDMPDLQATDPWVFANFLSFVYTGEMVNSKHTAQTQIMGISTSLLQSQYEAQYCSYLNPSKAATIHLQVDLYALADFLLTPTLQERSRFAFCELIFEDETKSTASPCSTCIAWEPFILPSGVDGKLPSDEDLQIIPGIVRKVYGRNTPATDRGLRDIVLQRLELDIWDGAEKLDSQIGVNFRELRKDARNPWNQDLESLTSGPEYDCSACRMRYKALTGACACGAKTHCYTDPDDDDKSCGARARKKILCIYCLSYGTMTRVFDDGWSSGWD